MRNDILPSINLYDEVSDLVRQIPRGSVSTPKRISDALGDPKAVKAVIEILKDWERSEELPVHRVITEKGEPLGSNEVKERCLQVLEEEGVKISANGVRDVDLYLFNKFRSGFPLRKIAELQQSLAQDLVLENTSKVPVRAVAAVDVAYKGRLGFGFFVIMNCEFRTLEEEYVQVEVSFPYISGYLAFREAPVILKALEKAGREYDAVMINGQGIAHPRGCGLASHVGLILERPTIGITIRKLAGNVLPGRGSSPLIEHQGRIVGAKIERAGLAPIYVSPGNNITLQRSIETVHAFLKQHRIPEPLWKAHEGAKRILQCR
jgi:deoxyribonuclease V